MLRINLTSLVIDIQWEQSSAPRSSSAPCLLTESSQTQSWDDPKNTNFDISWLNRLKCLSIQWIKAKWLNNSCQRRMPSNDEIHNVYSQLVIAHFLSWWFSLENKLWTFAPLTALCNVTNNQTSEVQGSSLFINSTSSERDLKASRTVVILADGACLQNRSQYVLCFCPAALACLDYCIHHFLCSR